MLELPSFPATSLANTTIVFDPVTRGTTKPKPGASVWRVAPFRLYSSEITPVLSIAVPVTVRLELVRVALLLGLVMLTVGLAMSVKLALTALALSTTTVQAPVPVHAPPQPAKLEPVAGVGVSVTLEPLAYGSSQSVPQLIPAGLLVTVPTPEPVLLTLSETAGGV